MSHVVHYCAQAPRDASLVPKPLRTPCGFFSASVTSDPHRVTCKTCRRLVQPLLESTPTTPTPKSEKPTMRSSISTALFFLTATLVAGCGTPVAGLTTSDESTSTSTTTADSSSSGTDSLTSSSGEEASTGAGASDSASTSGAGSLGADTLDDAGLPDNTSTGSGDGTSTSSSEGMVETSSGGDTSTGEGSTSEGGAGEPVVCYGDPCSAVGCAGGMTCVPSPPTGLAVCVMPCTPDDPCIIAAFVCSPDVGPHGVCAQDESGMSWCFPK